MLIGLGLLQNPEIYTASTLTDLARRHLLENLELQIRGHLTGRMKRPVTKGFKSPNSLQVQSKCYVYLIMGNRSICHLL